VRVKDLQQYLSKFTEAKSDGSRQGNAISNAIVMVEKDGYLEEIKRMEVHEHSSPLIGHSGTAHRLVLKSATKKNLIIPPKLKNTY